MHRGQVPEYTDVLDDLDVLFFGDVSASGRKDRYIKLENLMRTLDRPRYITDSAPTVNDDEAAGVEIGNRWLDTTGPTLYMCTDNTTGAAVWSELNDWSS